MENLPSARILGGHRKRETSELSSLRQGWHSQIRKWKQSFKNDPFSGLLFVFRNHRRDLLKVLWWDSDGLAIFYKRLEKGSYQLPTDTLARTSKYVGHRSRPRRTLRDRADVLGLLLDGIDLGSVKRRPRYERPKTKEVDTRGHHRFVSVT